MTKVSKKRQVRLEILRKDCVWASDNCSRSAVVCRGGRLIQYAIAGVAAHSDDERKSREESVTMLRSRHPRALRPPIARRQPCA